MDYPLQLLRLVDESKLERDGSVTHLVRADFLLGKFGPFVERFPKEGFDASQVTLAADKLRATLVSLHS